MHFRSPYFENEIYLDFDRRINDFVGSAIDGYEPFKYDDTKVIHDPVWGSILLYPWELQILDSPLMQRLRRVNQVGLAVLTYPSAHHSRFEHTLGVTNIVSRVVENINRFEAVDSYCKITDRDLYVLRLAALLHDVGHCFYSHLSESVYGKLKEFEKLKSSIEEFSDVKEHEIFSFIIINTARFKAFFDKYVNFPDKHKEDINVLFHEIGLMIVGAFSKRKSSLGSIAVKKCI